MKMKKIGYAASSVTLVAAMFMAGASAAAEKQLKIGVLGDMSGPYAEVAGPGSVEAARMAAEDMKDSLAAKGFTVEILAGDHQNKPDIGTGIVRKWFDVDGVDVVSDVPVSSVALAVQTLARENKKIVLFSSAGSDRISNADCSPYTAQWTFDTNAVGRATARTMIEEGGKSWYFLTADYVFGHALQGTAEDVVKSAGGKVLGAVRHPINSSDFSSYVLRAQSSGADVVGIASTGPDAQKAVAAMSEFGLLAGGQKAASLLMYESDVRSVGLETAQGLYLTLAFYWNLDEHTRTFSERYYKRMNAMPNMLQAGVYSSVSHYLKAVHALGGKDPDDVMAWMRANPVDDFFSRGGTLREDGLMIHDMYLLQVKSPAESEGPWDILKLVRRIPGDDAFKPLSESTCPYLKK